MALHHSPPLRAILENWISARSRKPPPERSARWRNPLGGPGYANMKFREAARLTFRGEAFNLFNRPQLSTPNNRVGVGGFGKITTTDGDPRILRFGLKVEF